MGLIDRDAPDADPGIQPERREARDRVRAGESR